MPGSIRVAVASDSGEELNAHFGTCRRFLIYQLSAGRVPADRRPPGRRRGRGRGQLRLPRPADRRLPRPVRAVDRRPGGGQGHQRGDLPAEVRRGRPGPGHLDELREKMASLPPPWLAKAMNVPVEDRIRFHVEAEDDVASSWRSRPSQVEGGGKLWPCTRDHRSQTTRPAARSWSPDVTLDATAATTTCQGVAAGPASLAG